MSDTYQPRPPKPRKRRSGVQIVGFWILAAAIVAAAAAGIISAVTGSKGKPAPVQTTSSLSQFIGPSMAQPALA